MTISDESAGDFCSIGIRKIIKLIMVSDVVQEVTVPVPREGQRQ
jgi:hypothetical protein